MTSGELRRILRNHCDELHDDFGVRSLSVYGSVARGDASDTSDVDLLVEFDRPAGFFQLERLQAHLESLLGCDVDVSTAASLRNAIRQRVAAEAIRVN